jgi:hypothetical protein
MKAMTSRIAAAAIVASLAACAPTQKPDTNPTMVDFHPVLSQNAVADGHVFEYHSTTDYPATDRTVVANGQVFEYN